MMRSLFSAISGLRNHMSYMDVVGNNIANVNTVAFKSSRVTFQDILSQNIRGAGSPQDGGRGGTNPAQIGLGMTLGGIDNVMTQGSIQSTGKLTDFAIQGDGFFVVSDGQRNYYTRDGAFDVGVDGSLVNPATGLRVMGWNADTGGNIDTAQELSALNVPFGSQIPARATADDATDPLNPIHGMSMTGNISAETPIAGTQGATITAYDSLGNAKTIRIVFTKDAANDWTVTAFHDIPDDLATDATTGGALDDAVTIANGGLTFATDGSLDTGATTGLVQFTIAGAALGTGAADLDFTLDLSSMSQFASSTQMVPTSNTGRPAGALVSFAVSTSGELTGIYSNGDAEVLGQVAMAQFVNPGGLNRSGQNLWEPTSNSGEALVGRAGEGGRGVINTGTLEGSNVDLAQQFTNMIIAQRGFQSSSRVITATDTLLQDLVNIIR